VWSSSCEACHNRQGATEGAMQVWIPFSPVQHVDCGCLVPERNGPRRRHRVRHRPALDVRAAPPRASTRAHAFRIGIISYRFSYHARRYGYLPELLLSSATQIVTSRKYVGRRFRIVSKNARRAAGSAPGMQIARATRARDITNCVDDYLVPRRAVSGPTAGRGPPRGGNALYRGGGDARLDPEAPDAAADSASGGAEI
jgi:hypothetical protein